MDLKEKILAEMVVNYDNQLDKNYDRAKKFIRLTPTGMVDVINKSEYQLELQIQMYLLGKLYSHHSGLSQSSGCRNSELENELGILGNSLRPVLKKLRDDGAIRTENHENFLQANFIDRVINSFERKQK